MGKEDLFFEEDPKAPEETKMTWEEHSDTFFGVLQGEGIVSNREDMSMAPMGVVPEMSAKVQKNGVVEIEFGVVKDDYTVHITPIHPKKNLSNQALFKEALKEAVTILNGVVPPELKVDIFLPRPDWEIKATSFVVRGGATAWNLDHTRIEKATVPLLLEAVTAVCMKA
jgi:hypothetical protein